MTNLMLSSKVKEYLKKYRQYFGEYLKESFQSGQKSYFKYALEVRAKTSGNGDPKVGIDVVMLIT